MSAFDLARKIITEFEGCALHAYQDIGGVWTIGWGCTHNVDSHMQIDQAEADRRLLEDEESTQDRIWAQIHVPLTDNQLAALISFTYNEGAGHLQDSNLEVCLNAHNYTLAADQFLRWDKCRGVVVPGLLRRREAERMLFCEA